MNEQDKKMADVSEAYALVTESILRSGNATGVEAAVIMIALGLKILKTTMEPDDFVAFCKDLSDSYEKVVSLDAHVRKHLH